MSSSRHHKNFDRRALLAMLGALPLAACETIDPAVIDGILGAGGALGGLSQAEAAGGIRAALDKGIGTAISTVGRAGGYFNDGKIRIPLPKTLQDIQGTLAPFGLSGLLDELELALNKGAERAAPLAKDLFVSAVSQLTIADAIAIVRGPANAATQYLSDKTLPKLTELFTPIAQDALTQTGAFQLFDDLAARTQGLPLVSVSRQAKGDLVERGVKGGLNGLFYYIGQQEAAIRANPAERTSEILRRVFGGAYA